MVEEKGKPLTETKPRKERDSFEKCYSGEVEKGGKHTGDKKK